MQKKAYPEITTVRLLLRKFSAEDAKDVQRMAGSEAVASNTLAMPFPYLDGMAEAWIATHEKEFEEGKSAVFAITLKESGQLIGAIGLSMQLHYKLAELGYWVGEDFWNRGYCTEAVKAVLDFAFNTLHLHKVTANHFAGNPASGRVMEKAGMHYEATLKSHILHWGKYKDLVCYAVFGNME